jgi:alanine racemase
MLEAAAHGSPVRVHLKVDTGLGRQGASTAEAVAIASRIAASPILELAGTMSHLAVPGEDDAYTEVQLVRLARTLDAMRSGGIDPGLVHVGATGSLLAGAGEVPAVRPGLALYGMRPGWASDELPLRPVLSLKALPLRIFDLPAGEPIGYGLRYRPAADTRIATLGIGYGDGWPRAHGNNGTVLVRGRRAPIVGSVCMDMLMADVTMIGDASPGDDVVIIGAQGGDRIDVREMAAQIGTIPYEILCRIGSRIERVYS